VRRRVPDLERLRGSGLSSDGGPKRNRGARIRPARSADIPELARLYRDALRGADPSEFPWWDAEELRRRWKAPNVVLGVEMFLLEGPDRLIGAMTIGRLDGDLEVDGLVIHPRFQQMGYGRRFVRFAERLAARRGHRRIVVEELMSQEGVPSREYGYWAGLGYRPILGPRPTAFSRRRGMLEVRLARDLGVGSRRASRGRPKGHR